MLSARRVDLLSHVMVQFHITTLFNDTHQYVGVDIFYEQFDFINRESHSGRHFSVSFVDY